MVAKSQIKIDMAIQNELEDLVTELHSTLITKRLKAVKSLGRLKTPIAVEPLSRVLSDRSREVRCAGVEALSLINPSNLAEILQPLVRDKSADVRLRVAHSLGVCDSAEAIDSLMTLMRDQRDEVAGMAARSLAKHPRSSLAPLIRQFGDKSWKIRSRAASAITRMGKGASEALRLAIDDNDSNIRFWSALCIGHLRDRSHSKILLEKLQDRDVGVRIAALRALREIGDPNVAAKLFEALSQPSEQIRDLIYEILKDFGTHSIPYLMDSLSSEYWMGRSLAAQALTDMGSEAVFPLVSALESQDKERRYWAIRILGKMHEQAAYTEIKKFLSDPDSEIRMAALESMGYYLNPDAVPAMIERFLDPAWVVRKHACRAIVKFGIKAVPYLLKALSSVEEDVRYWALRAIGEIKPRGIYPHLIKLFKDRSWTIRKTTSDVLGGYGEDALMELTALATDSSDSEARYWVLRSLGRIRAGMSLPLLFRALEDPSESIRDAAQKALGNYGSEIIDDLFALLKSEKRMLLESVCATFKRIGPALMIPKLCRNLGKFDEHVNYWIRRSLLGFANEARPYVVTLLQSKSEEIRRQAILSLGQIGRHSDSDAIQPHLKDEFWPARIAAAETLGTLGDTSSVNALIEALEDEDEDLAMAAIVSLGKIGDERAVPGLISTLQRESWTLKFQAIKILGEMRVSRAFVDLLKLLDEDTLDLKIHIIRAFAKISHPRCYEELNKRFEKEKDIEARLAYIEALSELGNPAIITEFVKISQNIENWEERRAAIRALGVMRVVNAKSVLIQALKDKDPVISREALAALGSILPPEEFNKTEKAIAAARKQQELFQKAFNEGMKQMRLGAMREAEKYLKEAIRINPRAAYVYSALGNLYYKTGKLIDATKAYVMATNTSPEDITLKLNLGMVYYRRRAYREAAQVFGKVAKAAGPQSQQGQYASKMLARINLEIRQNPTSPAKSE
ncbi:MAG: HEAT repeat domain-containing protein [Candidatus Riflebacteria bacterium]|nr:HEAT repeat domain-containing protein [Candidatus Riflebacteria bacterium]